MTAGENIVYIVGVGRSGTSLLMTLLNGHSKIAFTPETHFLRFYLGSPTLLRQNTESGVSKFEEALSQDSYFLRLGMDAKEVLAPWLSGQRSFALPDVYLEILEKYRSRKEKPIIGDKDPRYIDYLPLIKRICPTAKVIHIYRDPRDVVLSKTKAAWSAHRPYWLNAMISQAQIKRGRAAGKKLFGKNFYELSYESLLAFPQQSLTELLHFLGQDFEKDMLKLNKSAQELVDQSEIQWKSNTFKPVLNDNKEKWRAQLSPVQIRCIEIICKEWFDELGYEYAGVKIGAARDRFLSFLFAFEKVQQAIYNWQLTRQMNKGIVANKI